MDDKFQPDTQALGATLTPSVINSSWWQSPRADQDSAWHGHVGFANWLVQCLCPGIVVELGTHNGVSYAAFCNAVQKCNLETRCYAVDTWMGDAHAGSYGETVYSSILKFNNSHYAAFSTLMRCTFDEALANIADGSVDLLHIDGLHTYDAVAHDFRSWLPKLSNRAVVLFHDTAIRERDFGVWKLWEELTPRYPHFTFDHSAGLGVLCVGHHVPTLLRELCELDGSAEGNAMCKRFESASRQVYDAALQEKEAQRAQSHCKLQFEGKNVALGCHAAQSSGFLNSAMTPGGAVNGIRSGLFGFHTEAELNPWWMVDLGNRKTICEVVIFNRLDGECAARARALVVKTSLDGETWSELYRCDGTIFGGVDGNPLRIACGGTTTRFVRIQLQEFNYLHVDQVEIYSMTE